MENIFDKFKKLNLDTSPIGLSIELREPFFCTPIGAQIIGWDNGIHYCFIKGFKEIVFCVNPETCCNYYGSKISRNYWLFEPKCRNNAEITYTQRLQIASYFP